MPAPQTDEVEHGYLRIRKQDIPVRTVWIEQRKLKFFIDNPRIYSLVRAGGREPDQNEICTKLQDLEHVRVLKEDIKLNGGLIDPLIVRDGTLEVLEGNSRLAAYRWLYENDPDPLQWAKVKCTLLPADISEPLVFAILGQYHIKGKKDWAPYEQAGFLYRRFKFHKEDIPTVATELGIERPLAAHRVNVYEFMLTHKEDRRERWSFYDEYLKSRKIKKVREQYPDFDNVIVKKIRGKEFTALDLRDKLPAICVGPERNLRRFVEGKIPFDEAYDNAMDAGGGNSEFKRLYKFRQWLAKAEREKGIVEVREKNIRDKIEFELDKIEKRSKQLKGKMTARSVRPT